MVDYIPLFIITVTYSSTYLLLGKFLNKILKNMGDKAEVYGLYTVLSIGAVIYVVYLGSLFYTASLLLEYFELVTQFSL